MSIVRFSVGGGAIVLSLLGFLICIAGVFAAWTLKNRVDVVSRAAFGAADESLVFVDAKVDRVRRAVDNGRRRVSGISEVAERLRTATADARAESEPLLHALEEVRQELQAAESWLESCHAVAQGVSRVSEAVVSSEYAASHEESTGIVLARRLQELSATVAEALATLQALRQEIMERRDKGQLAREIAVRIVARVADLDGNLENISARLEEFGGKVKHANASIGGLQQRVHWWTSVTAVAITVLVAWFGVSQISMMGHGWRVMHRKSKAPAA